MRITEETLRLENQVCFALHAAARAFDSLYRVLLRETGLTYPQYLVLLALWEHGELSVKDLGRTLRLDSGTLSPLLKRLESAGAVERSRNPKDERSVIVRVTTAGDALRERASEVAQRISASTGMDLTTAEELRSRLNDLTRMLDAAVHSGAEAQSVA